MKKAKERMLVLLGGMFVLVIAAGVGFQMLTEQMRVKAVARIELPSHLNAYRQLTRAIEARDAGVSQTTGEISVQIPEEFPPDVAEIMDEHTRLREMAEERLGDDTRWWAIGALLDKPLDELTPEDRTELREFLDDEQGLIAEIKRMAERGGPILPLDLSEGFALLLPHLSPLRDCVRLLRADALSQAMEGNIDGAVEDIVAGMKLSDALKDEPILISQLVRVAMHGIMEETIRDAFEPGMLTPDQLRQLQIQLATGDHREGIVQSMSSEAYVGLNAFNDIRTGELGVRELMGDTGSGDPLGSIAQDLALRAYTSALARPWFNMDEAAYADTMSIITEAAALPYYEILQNGDGYESNLNDLPRTRVLTRMLAPALSRVLETQARHEATLDLAQMGLALEQHYALTGAYPDSLGVIASQLGGSLPVDPFTGDAYQYQPAGSSFQLYSLGVNGEDDGGYHDRDDGDVVWRGETD